MPDSGNNDIRVVTLYQRIQHMYNNRNRPLVYLAIALIAICECFGCVQKTRVTVTRHAEVSLQGIKTLGILKFDGLYEDMVRKALYNKSIEAQNLNKVDDIRVINIEKNSFENLEGLHADGVISGRVTANIKDVYDTERVKIQEGTGEYKKGKNVFGQEAEVEIQRIAVREVPCVMRQANIIVDFNIFNLKTKQRIFADKVSEEYKEKFGGENEYRSYLGNRMSQLPSQNLTMEELSDKVASRIVTKIFTTRIIRFVEFDDGSKYGTVIGGNKNVKEGIKCAKNGEWGKAVEIWKNVLNVEPENSAAFYNLGIAYENIGDLENLKIAQKMYKKAVRHGNKVIYLDAMQKIKETIRDFPKESQTK